MAEEQEKPTDPNKLMPFIVRNLLSVTSLMVLFAAVTYQVVPISYLTAGPLDTVGQRLIFTLQWNVVNIAIIQFMALLISHKRRTSHQQNPFVTTDREKVEVLLIGCIHFLCGPPP